MSLYDDFEPLKQKADQVAGWSSGIKLFQSQMQLKKAALGQPRRESYKKSNTTLAPVMDLKSQRIDDARPPPGFQPFLPNTPKEPQRATPAHGGVTISSLIPSANSDMDWCFQGAEYDPMWPNDYEKAVRDLRDLKDKQREREDEERRRRRDERNRKSDPGESRRATGNSSDSDSDTETPAFSSSATPIRKGGAAIAPPPSLQESSGGNSRPDPKSFGASVAAKIMAKYGFREGQGLGKKEQGMSSALQVEKTSKRGGRIIHEKDIMPPPSLAPPSAQGSVDSPTHSLMPPPPPLAPTDSGVSKMGPPPAPTPEPSITEIMKSPSKVVLLRNMVGPGEVDSDLEPEVKDECNTKYGEVIRVIIHELPTAPDDESIRIFVEFKRIESAIKAVVDLNGRFFGGRQVKAGFYKWEKLNNLELLD
ncbi:hypothetical protein M8J75_001015 [Diaphorina citri]|nr:hypothetical protein M8J75_001015 [Diaphorina citri]KAI5708191.1 hypothetical protein M8J77_017823 [Diaphorina citri]